MYLIPFWNAALLKLKVNNKQIKNKTTWILTSLLLQIIPNLTHFLYTCLLLLNLLDAKYENKQKGNKDEPCWLQYCIGVLFKMSGWIRDTFRVSASAPEPIKTPQISNDIGHLLRKTKLLPLKTSTFSNMERNIYKGSQQWLG